MLVKLTIIINPRDDAERELAASVARHTVGQWTENSTEVRYTLETDSRTDVIAAMSDAEAFPERTIIFRST